MLLQRVTTALFLLLLLAAAIFFLNSPLFVLFLTLVTLLGAWEWSLLAGIVRLHFRILYCAVLLLLMLFAYLVPGLPPMPVFLFSAFFWLCIFILLYHYPSYTQHWNKKPVLVLMGICVLFPCWFALVTLRGAADFIYSFLMLIFLVAAADSGAYFAGRFLGRHKLAAQVSPNKTWEGVAGGLLSCFVVSLCFAWIGYRLNAEPLNWMLVLLLPVIVSFFSIVGDLSESMLKRLKQVKDSGRLLPGHGGILDRIDGLVAAAPVYLLLLYLAA